MTVGTGRLVLCSTPIGNLEDVTLRVLRVLRACDVIFAEDTRVTLGLLRHFGIEKPLRSFHERVEPQRLRELRALLAEDKTVAMVSDAGTPGISDPGAQLVRAAREVGAHVEALPGPSALLDAAVLSGFDVARFRFDGYPPRKSGARRAYLRSLADEPVAIVWYEAPTRVVGLLDDVARLLPERRVFVLREHTKLFEQQVVGRAADAAAQLERPARGEFTIVLEGRHATRDGPPSVPENVRDAIATLIDRGASVRVATESMRLATGLPKSALYKVAQELKEQASRSAR